MHFQSPHSRKTTLSTLSYPHARQSRYSYSAKCNSKYSKAPPPEHVHNAPGKGASIYKFTQSYNQVRG